MFEYLTCSLCYGQYQYLDSKERPSWDAIPSSFARA